MKQPNEMPPFYVLFERNSHMAPWNFVMGHEDRARIAHYRKLLRENGTRPENVIVRKLARRDLALVDKAEARLNTV